MGKKVQNVFKVWGVFGQLYSVTIKFNLGKLFPEIENSLTLRNGTQNQLHYIPQRCDQIVFLR